VKFDIHTVDLFLGSYAHGKPGKVMEFKNGSFQAWKSPGNVIIYAEFE